MVKMVIMSSKYFFTSFCPILTPKIRNMTIFDTHMVKKAQIVNSILIFYPEENVKEIPKRF
jgi:hypothetical protein